MNSKTPAVAIRRREAALGTFRMKLDVLERLAILEPSNPRIARDLASLRERVDGLN